MQSESSEKVGLEIFNEILSDVFDWYHHAPLLKKPAIVEETKSATMKLTFEPLFKAHQVDIIRTIKFRDKKQQEQPLHHLRVIHQWAGNLCGYHMLYNILSTVKMLKSQKTSIPNLLLSKPLFWKFHHETGNYLIKFARHTHQDMSRWPWDPNSLKHGVLERTYLKVILRRNEEVRHLLESTPSFKIKVMKLNIQFGRFIKSYRALRKVQEQINDFVTHTDPNVHNLKYFCLAAVNHWSCLMAHKIGTKVELFFLDSLNRDFLHMNQQEIATFIEQLNQKRLQDHKPPWSNFQKQMNAQAQIDAQMIVNTLADCLLGKTDLVTVEANLVAKVVLDGYLDYFEQYTEIKLANYAGILTSQPQVPADLFGMVMDQWEDSYQSLLQDIVREGLRLNAMSDEYRKPCTWLLLRTNTILSERQKTKLSNAQCAVF